jgi:DNA-binding transcriptional ArsR family regulator
VTDRQRIPHRLLLQLVDEFQVFGQVVRLRLIEYLQGGRATPQEIADELGLSQQNVSKHLQVLFKAGVVSRRREGSSVLHALADERAVQILEVNGQPRLGSDR